MRVIDLHSFPNTAPWVASYGSPFVEALAEYWKRPWTGKEESEVAEEFRANGVSPVLVAFDIESVTGAPPCSNEYVAGFRDRYPDVIAQAWGSVDPHKETAIADAKTAIIEHKLLGFHFHPIMGRFSVDDRAHYPLFETIAELNVPVMIDVGTTGMGAGLPGGSGSRIHNAHPRAIDGLAADFPTLQIVAAHPGWPWIEEMTAVALHKGNVSWELSGWAPKYLPEHLRKDIKGRLRDKIMFGSDYPSIPYERLFREWNDLGLPDEVMEQFFHGNAERILGL